MKLRILVLLLTFSSSLLGQTKECDCSGPLSRDLKTFISEKEYSDFKDWLYIYYQKDSTGRNTMKSNSSSSFGAKITAVIKSIPITGQGNYDKNNSKDVQKYYHVEQSYLKNRFVTNEELNELFVEEFSDNQLAAYKACLDLCPKIAAYGVSLFTGSDLKDEFYIQVNFKSSPSGGKITLSGNAQILNMEPIGGLIFRDSLVIKDGQSKTQYFKRLDPTKPASFTLNFQDGIIVPPINLPSKPSINQQAIPIGTIVSSILDYATFLRANNLSELDNTDMSTVLWIPCDGRRENKSKYSSYSGGNIPDLRGVFLRGINDYGVTYSTVYPVNENQKNPDNNVAGQFQNDALKKHVHNQIWGQNGGAPNTNAQGNNLANYKAYKMSQTTSDNIGGTEETRPKNITVYYYIKIN